jgi:hypothetical protein
MRRLRGRADHRGQLRIDLLESVVGGNAPGIVRAASELVRLYPENRFYTYLLGRGKYTTGEYRRCLDTLAPLVAQRYTWSWTYVLSARSAEQFGDLTGARDDFERGLEVTHGDPELAYAYARDLRTRGERQRIGAVLEQGLRSPSLAESPTGGGELRLEHAKLLAERGQGALARAELERACALLPREDEAWAEADSLRRSGLR